MLLQTPINKNKTIQELADKALKQVLDDTTANGVTIREWIKKISSGEYQPVKHGSWENGSIELVGMEHKRCLNCEYRVTDDEANVFHYCPNCGAIMDGGDEE